MDHQLNTSCKGSENNTKAWKRTLTFEEGKIRIATNYPPKLVDAIARGIKAQLVLDGQTKEIGHVGGPDPHEEANYEECQHEMLPDATELYVKEPVIDANTGVELDPKKVAVARATELEWIKKQNVYSKVPTSMCYQETNRQPITLKWVDRNKGDEGELPIAPGGTRNKVSRTGGAHPGIRPIQFNAATRGFEAAVQSASHFARFAQRRQAVTKADRYFASTFLRASSP